MAWWMLAGLLLVVDMVSVDMVSVDMAHALADPTAEQGVYGVEFEDARCEDGLHLVVVTMNDTAVCVTAEDGAMMESEGEGFFYDPPFSKATIIRDTVPVLEEIYYWSKYDVEFPPRAQELEAVRGYEKDIVYLEPPLSVGWSYHNPPDWLDLSNPPTITNIGRGLGPDDEAFWPQYAMETPHKGGRYYLYNPFELTYNYAYVIPGDGGDYVDPKYRCPEERCGDYFLQVQTSVNVNLTNEDAEFILQATDTTRDGFHYNVYRMPLPFDNTKPMQLTLQFHGLDTSYPPNKYWPIGMIYPHVHDAGDAMYFEDVSSHAFIVFDTTLGSNSLDQSWYGPHYDDPAKQREIRAEWMATYPDSPVGVIRSPPPVQDGPIDGVAPAYYLHLAGNLVENYPLGDYARILRDSNVKQEWIDGFLDAVPYLKPTLLEVILGQLEQPALGPRALD